MRYALLLELVTVRRFNYYVSVYNSTVKLPFVMNRRDMNNTNFGATKNGVNPYTAPQHGTKMDFLKDTRTVLSQRASILQLNQRNANVQIARPLVPESWGQSRLVEATDARSSALGLLKETAVRTGTPIGGNAHGHPNDPKLLGHDDTGMYKVNVPIAKKFSRIIK